MTEKIGRIRPEWRSYAFAVLMVAVATLVFVQGRAYFAKGQWALLYLLIIVYVAARWGVRPAILSVVVAFLCWNFFFLHPYNTFHVHAFEDWLSLFAFLIVGIIMGMQTGRLRERETLARMREQLQAIAVQADALREADRMKSTFVSSISHELKTPLASTTATLTNLLEGDINWDESTAREEISAVLGDLERLNDSIGSLVDLSRLESAAWNQDRDWYEPGEMLGTVMSRIPQRKRERIAFSLPDDLPPVSVDYAQWVRMLSNLIENALDYTDGRVRVGASAGDVETRIWVEDDGPGIPPEEQEHIFEKFYRGSASSKVSSGTGLGLAIVKEIVRSHGGRVSVEDVDPHGARFVVSLPNGVQNGDIG